MRIYVSSNIPGIFMTKPRPLRSEAFFVHSFEVKGQNGFWEEVEKILLPYFLRGLPSYGNADRLRDFFS